MKNIIDISRRRAFGTCVFCGDGGPFTGEHVIPAGLGGDDENFILKEVVCGNCNTRRFSVLESHFMRESTRAVSRLLYQNFGRNKKPLSLNQLAEIVDGNGRSTIATVEAGLSGKILPQLIVNLSDKIEVSTNSKEDLIDFFGELEALLATNVVTLIMKIKNELKTEYAVTRLEWDGSAYRRYSQEMLIKPPLRGIWLETLVASKLVPRAEVPLLNCTQN